MTMEVMPLSHDEGSSGDPGPDLRAAFYEHLTALAKAVALGGTPEEQPLGGPEATFAFYSAAVEHNGGPRDVIRQPVDVARLMREGAPPPDMLVDEWLVRGELHWIYAEAEGAKTWLALWLAVKVMNDGGTVLWVDEELGPTIVSERLVALGADPEVVAQQFIYLPFPGWSATDADKASWLVMVATYRPAFVVFDTATDALANADLDENNGVQVTGWVKAYCEPPRYAGAAVAVLDHTTKNGETGKHPVASRAKRAKAKVMYALDTTAKFDRETVGKVKIKRTKNTIGAAIPAERMFEAGGEDGRFVWKPTISIDTRGAAEANADAKLQQKVVETLQAHDRPLSQTMLAELIGGNKTKALSAIRDVAAAPEFWGIRVFPGERNAIMYEHVGDGGDDAE
jgi:hypothetical protein